jgi:hypothetical protein
VSADRGPPCFGPLSHAGVKGRPAPSPIRLSTRQGPGGSGGWGGNQYYCCLHSRTQSPYGPAAAWIPSPFTVGRRLLGAMLDFRELGEARANAIVRSMHGRRWAAKRCCLAAGCLCACLAAGCGTVTRGADARWHCGYMPLPFLMPAGVCDVPTWLMANGCWLVSSGVVAVRAWSTDGEGCVAGGLLCSVIRGCVTT